MSNEIVSAPGVNVAQGSGLAIVFESRLIRFSGSWRIEENDAIVQPTTNQFDYLININNHNHLVHTDDIGRLTQAVKNGDRDEVDIDLRLIKSDGGQMKLFAHGRLANAYGIASEIHPDEVQTNLELELKLFRYSEMSAQTASWKWNLDTNSISFTENVYLIFGLDPSKPLSSWDDLLSYVHKNDRHKVGELISVIQHSGKITTIEFRIEKGAGKALHYLRAKAEIYTTRNGHRYCIGAMHDITEQKLAEDKLKETELLISRNQEEAESKIQSQETLFKESEIVGGLGSYEVQLPEQIFTFSDNMFRLLGYKPKAFRPTLDFIDSISVPEDAKEVRKILEDAVAQKKSYSYSRRIYLPNGQLRYINSKGKVVCDANGTPLKVVGIAQDVTHQKLTELALEQKKNEQQEADQKLREAHQLLSGVLNAPNNRTIVFEAVRNKEGRIIDFVFRLVSKASDEILHGKSYPGTSVQDAFPELFAQQFMGMCEVVNTGEMRAYEELYNADGTEKWFHVTDAKFEDGIVRVWEDVTERKNAEDQLRASRELLQTALDSSLSFIQVLKAERDANGKIVDFTWVLTNRKWNEQYGSVVGKHLLTENPGVAESGVFEKFVQVTESGEPIFHEHYYRYEQFDGWYNQSILKQGDGVILTSEDITAKKAFESSLKESKELLNSVIQSDIVALSVFQPVYGKKNEIVDFEWIIANGLQKAIAQGKELVGKRYLDIFPDAKDNGRFELMKRVFHKGEKVVSEFYHQDYNVRGWFRGTYVKVNGLMIVSAEDITESKQVEDILREEHKRLKDAQSIGHVGSFEWSASTDRIIWSDEMYRIHGLKPQSEQITHQRAIDFIHPDDRPTLEQKIRESMMTVKRDNILHRILREDGAIAYVSRTWESFANAEGKVVLISGTCHDISESWEAEEQLQKNLTLLQQTEEVASMGSWEFLLEKDSFRWSEGMYRLFELPRDAKITPKIYLELAVPEDFEKAEKIVDAITKGTGAFEEIVKINVNNNIKTVKIKGSVLRNAAGVPMKVLGVDLDITAIVESQRALQEQVHFINRVVETMPDMLTVMRLPDGRIEYANQDALVSEGYSSEMIEPTDSEKRSALIHPADLEAVKYYFARFSSLTDDVVNTVEYRAQNNLGIWQWYRARGKVFRRNEAGIVTHCVNVVQNINMQKLAEEKVREQGHFIQRLVDTVPDTIFIYDLNLKRLIYSNPEVYQLLGYTPDELEALNENIFQSCIHPDDQDRQKSTFSQLASSAENEVVDAVLRMIHRDTSVKTVQVRFTPFKRGVNGKISQIVAVFHDISALKKTEAETIQMKEMLAQKAEDRYRGLFNSMDQGFCIVEVAFDKQDQPVDFLFRETNPAFEKLTGWRDAAGKHIGEFAQMEEYWFETFGNVARGRRPIRFVQKAQAIDNHWFELYAFPSDEDQPNRVAVLFSDITERRNHEHQLRELNRKLLESDRMKTDFFSNVSHEFRTPLTLLLAPLGDLIKNGGHRMDADEFEKVRMAHRNALRLQKMVNTLLDFARIEAGKADAVFQPTDIAKLTEELASTFRSTIENGGLTFTVKCKDDGDPIYLNREMYEKIVLNLLSNAFKFTLQGKIEVVVKGTKKHVQLVVRDTGVGIAKENMEKIFQRFTRIDRAKSRTYEGTGIGLALVSELVTLHGGKIKVESEEGVGTEFIAFFPRGKSHLDARKIFESWEDNRHSMAQAYVEELGGWIAKDEVVDHPLQRDLKMKKTSGKGHQYSIILADDNADMRAYLTSLLSDDYNLITVENGEKVIELLKKGITPNLILSDVMMPGMNGFELLRVIKSNEKWNQLPVILISARAGEESRIEGMEFGADDYLIKPFSARELLTRVKSRIEISALQIQRQELLKDLNQQLEKHVLERTREIEESRDQLREQKEILQRCMDAMPQLIWTTDPFGNFLSFNERWYNYTGLSHEQAKGENYLTSGVIHPSQLKEIKSKWQHSINEGVPYANETLIRNKDGGFCWHIDLVTPIRNENGEIYMWIGTLTNVHDQFMAEKQVEEQRSLLETILNSSPNGIQVLDAVRDEVTEKVVDFEWKYCNSVVQAHFTSNDLIGKRLTDEYRDAINSGMLDKLKEVILLGEPIQFEHNLVRNDSVLNLNVFAVKLEDSVVVTLQDVTSRVQSERETQSLNKALQAKNNELESMNEQLSTFAFIASHDLREPLRKINYFVNGIREVDGHVLSEKGKAYFDKVVLSLQRMNSMISDILKFSRTNAGTEDFSEVDLNNILTVAINDLSEAIKEKEAVISSDRLPKIQGNKIQLIQLFENLLSNAIKFHKRAQRPEVVVSGNIVQGKSIEHLKADPEKNYLLIQVTDKGIGFDEQYSVKIFQMFQRLHGISEYPGTGMGLAICKKIVENHGGFMDVKSKPGEGSIFECYFPIHR